MPHKKARKQLRAFLLALSKKPIYAQQLILRQMVYIRWKTVASE